MDRALTARFDAAADDYDRSRPGYPDELVRSLGPPCDVIEVGCGSGQLTADLLGQGHRVVAVDPAPGSSPWRNDGARRPASSWGGSRTPTLSSPPSTSLRRPPPSTG